MLFTFRQWQMEVGGRKRAPALGDACEDLPTGRLARRLRDVHVDAPAGNPDALPLLQYTLHELYLQRSNSRQLTVAAYLGIMRYAVTPEVGNTGVTPFSLRLVARMKGNIASGFISSDPQVTNSPNSDPPPK